MPPHAPPHAAVQAEVESFYINNGYMFPSFHKFYWMGLRAANSLKPADLLSLSDNTWPSFSYIDGSPSPGGPVYEAWGRFQPLNFPEPDNRFAPELCAGGNASEAFGAPKAWGWADTRCNNTSPFICRLQRECQLCAHSAQVCVNLPARFLSKPEVACKACHQAPPYLLCLRTSWTPAARHSVH